MNRVLKWAAVALATLGGAAQVAGAQAVNGRTQISWVADRVASTATTEGLFTVARSTVGPLGLSNAATQSVAYTVTKGKTLHLSSLQLASESGGSAPANSRADLRVRISTSATAGLCSTSSPIVLEAIVSSTGTASTVGNLGAPPVGDGGLEVLGNGATTLCFTLQTPDWVTSTNVPLVTAVLTGYEY
jgi:hypothetical protein